MDCITCWASVINICVLFFYHALSFSQTGSVMRGAGEMIGPFAAKLGERGPWGLGGASSENVSQFQGLAGTDRRMRRACSGLGKAAGMSCRRPSRGFLSWWSSWDQGSLLLTWFKCIAKAEGFRFLTGMFWGFISWSISIVSSEIVVEGGQSIIWLLNFHVYIAFVLK